MKFSKLAEQKQSAVVKAAHDLNFYGKRLKSKSLEVCEQALATLDLNTKVEAVELYDYLVANRPVKAKPAKRATALQEEFEPTFKGSNTERDSELEVLPTGKYIISSAQNNTLESPFLASLIDHSKVAGARLILMPIKYTTTLESAERKNPTYAASVAPFMIFEDVFIGSRDGVRLGVSATILPTAKQPINTARTMNQGEAITIVASPRAQTKTLPRPKGSRHRWTYTSRTVTQRHYTDSRAGGEAEQDHVFGAVYLVVNDDGTIEHQELMSDQSGHFFNPLVGNPTGEVHGMVAGDLHLEKMCPYSFAALKRDVSHFSPEWLVTHDTLDFMSRNHHNRKSGRFLYQMGQRSVIDDLTAAITGLNELAALVPFVFVVRSNHDDALDQWLDDNNYRPDSDVINAKTYYFLKFHILEFLDNPTADELNCFALACETLSGQVPELAQNVQFGALDQEFLLNGVDVGSHGHIGSGGARGSAATFQQYQKPMVVGHSHSPNRNGRNFVQVGVTGSLEMGYNKGGSAWDRSNALILDDGTIIMCQPFAINEPQY